MQNPIRLKFGLCLLKNALLKFIKALKQNHGGTAFEAFFILTGAPYEIHDVNKNDRSTSKWIVKNAEKQGYIMATSGNDYMNSIP